MFKIGMKVVCVMAPLRRDAYQEICPTVGDVLTIREIVDGDGLLFVEIVNDKQHYSDGYKEVSFRSSRFVPLLSTMQRITFEKVIEMVEVSTN